MRDVQRREFLRLVASGLAAPFLVTFDPRRASAASQVPSVLRFDAERVFDLSVASGDPSARGIVLWTHVKPESFEAATPFWFQIARDAAFAELVLEGQLPVGSGGPERDHTVSVAVDAALAAGQRYYYRFVYGDMVSRVGRCRTLPSGSPSLLKLGLLTCQDFTNGYYGAFRHLAADDSIDFLLHLGDFIYESVGDPRFQSLELQDRWLFLPSGSSVSLGLDDYRYLYRSYRGDPQLQRLLEQHTLLAVPDDHETANDCYWDYARDTLGAPDHPFASDAGALRQLKLDSQRAWLEYVPSRALESPGAAHPHDYSRSYRGFEFGDLARLSLLDTRSYRSPHPCGEGDVFERYLPIGCAAVDDAGRTLLGTAQKSWLEDQLARSGPIWSLIGNQTLFAPLRLGYGSATLPINVDAWDGCGSERRGLARFLRSLNRRNTVLLTGDMHSYVASHVLANFEHANPLDTDNLVGVEFMTPSVTSSNLFETLAQQLQGSPALRDGLSEVSVRLNNPHIQYFNSSRYGYSTLEVRRDRVDWTAYAVDKNADPASAERSTLAKFRKYAWFPWLIRV